MSIPDELKGGPNTMILDLMCIASHYFCTSTFNEGMFMQKLLTYRRPNQANDYVEKREPQVFETVKEADKSTAPSSQENLDKAEKSPVRKLSKEDLENLNYHGPGALGGISRQATVEIPSANLGLNPAALGGSVFRTVAEAQTIAGELAAGTFDIKNFVPESAMKSIETVNGVTHNCQIQLKILLALAILQMLVILQERLMILRMAIPKKKKKKGAKPKKRKNLHKSLVQVLFPVVEINSDLPGM